jgi:formyl-CoA transferase
LADDTRFSTNGARVTYRRALEGILAEALAGRERAGLLAELSDAGVPAGPILDVADALAQPAAEPLIHETEREDGTRLRGVRSVSLEPSTVYQPRELAPPPYLGEHTDAVLRQLPGLEAARTG